MIALNINGRSHTFSSTVKVADLVRELGLEGKRVAIERNGAIIPRSNYASVELADGDVLEIVVAVGGG